MAAKGGFIFVTYQESITLKIPFAATNLADNQNFPHSKLTMASLEELNSLAKESGLLCRVNQVIIGIESQRT